MVTENSSIPDGGWGWIVVMASFMVCLMVGGTTCTFGLFYYEFLSYYGESKGKTSWIASIMVATSYCVGPLSSALANRFGCRVIAIIGSIIAAVGLIISTQAPNVLTLYFTIGILTGGGFCLMYLPAIVMVSSYFDKKLALATGLAVCGTGLGIFVLAPLTEYLLKIMAWQWTMTVIAALVLSSVISGALFRPVVYCPQKEPSSNSSFVKQNSNTHIIPSIEFINLEQRTELNFSPRSDFEAGTTNNEHNFLGKIWNSFREVMDFSLLNDPVFLLFGISNLLTNIGLIVPYIYIKNLVLEAGIASTEKAGFLLAVNGISNTIGRIVLGYLSDKSCFNRLWIFNTCLLICGISVVLACFTFSYALIAAYLSIFGVTSEPCLWNSDCENGGACEDQGEFKLCQCKQGVIGDKCEFVRDCFNKYVKCREERGTCSYDVENEKAVCTCSGNKALHPYENICKETCRADDDCQNNGICKEKGGNGFCECKPEIKGDRCETIYDCTSGKYKNCKGENGTCSYNFQINAAECICPHDKKLHDKENICKVSIEACLDDTDCQNGGSCIAVGESKFCQCKDGVTGDRCQTVVDCDSGNFKNCKGDNGTCFYDQQRKTAACNCRFNKTFDPFDGICKETCRDDSDCQNGGSCRAVGESKFCQCKDGVIGDRCQTVIDCISGKYRKCKGENGSCSYDQQRNRVVCHCPDNKTFNRYEGICKVERNTTTVRTTNSPSLMTTILMSTSSECYCGRHSYSCFYDAFLGKVCRCLYGYIQVNGSCTAIKYNTSTTEKPITTSKDCDCGKNSYYCHFDWSGTKVCDCNYGYVQIDGYCTGICNDDKCLHGQCQVHGQVYRCKCYEGYSGSRCENKIQTKPDYQMMWRILILSFIVAMFLMMSIMLCITLRQRKK